MSSSSEKSKECPILRFFRGKSSSKTNKRSVEEEKEKAPLDSMEEEDGMCTTESSESRSKSTSKSGNAWCQGNDCSGNNVESVDSKERERQEQAAAAILNLSSPPSCKSSSIQNTCTSSSCGTASQPQQTPQAVPSANELNQQQQQQEEAAENGVFLKLRQIVGESTCCKTTILHKVLVGLQNLENKLMYQMLAPQIRHCMQSKSSGSCPPANPVACAFKAQLFQKRFCALRAILGLNSTKRSEILAAAHQRIEFLKNETKTQCLSDLNHQTIEEIVNSTETVCYHTIFKSSFEPLVVASLDGRIVDCNESFLLVSKATLADVKTWNLLTMFVDDDIPTLYAMIQTLFSCNGKQEVTNTLRGKCGTPLKAAMRLLVKCSKPKWFLVAFRSCTHNNTDTDTNNNT